MGISTMTMLMFSVKIKVTASKHLKMIMKMCATFKAILDTQLTKVTLKSHAMHSKLIHLVIFCIVTNNLLMSL